MQCAPSITSTMEIGWLLLNSHLCAEKWNGSWYRLKSLIQVRHWWLKMNSSIAVALPSWKRYLSSQLKCKRICLLGLQGTCYLHYVLGESHSKTLLFSSKFLLFRFHVFFKVFAGTLVTSYTSAMSCFVLSCLLTFVIWKLFTFE